MKKFKAQRACLVVFMLAMSVFFSSSLVYGRDRQPEGGTLAAVNLRVAGNFVILSKTGITDVPTSAITGYI